MFSNAAGLKFAGLAAISFFILLLHGFHLFGDDAGIYTATIERSIRPALFPGDIGFVAGMTRYSCFAWLVAAPARVMHIQPEQLLFSIYCLSIVCFVSGAWMILVRLFHSSRARWSAMALAAVLYTLPVAGTSLSIMDPYLTARSFSLPLTLFALAAAMSRRWTVAALLVLGLLPLHPLMAIAGGMLIACYALISQRRWGLLALLPIASLFACSIAAFFDKAAPSAAELTAVTLPGHSYLFLSRWLWYEKSGLLLPLLLLLYAAFGLPAKYEVARRLALAAALAGATAWLCVLCLVHPGGSLLLVRLQLLRVFAPVYAVGVLLLGGLLGEFCFTRLRMAAFSLAAILSAGALLTFQLTSYPSSAHIEWDRSRCSVNKWEEGFFWIREHTPVDALFALDSAYTLSPGEDVQGFRAAAERNSLADNAKDSGLAVIFPSLAPEWLKQSLATKGLDTLSDQERLARLAPYGVTWIVLRSASATSLSCPYQNAAMKVCELKEPTADAKPAGRKKIASL